VPQVLTGGDELEGRIAEAHQRVVIGRERERDVPHRTATRGIEREDVRGAGATEEAAVVVRRAAIGREVRRRLPGTLLPLERAGAGVDRVSDGVGGEVHRAVHDDRTRLEGDLLVGVVHALLP